MLTLHEAFAKTREGLAILALPASPERVALFHRGAQLYLMDPVAAGTTLNAKDEVGNMTFALLEMLLEYAELRECMKIGALGVMLIFAFWCCG